MTPCIGQTRQRRHTQYMRNVVSPNAKQTPPMARTCHAVWRMARLESRRRARQAAIPPRVGACSLRTEDTRMGLPSICSLHGSGNPPNGSILVGGGKETKHGIPLVAASEMGKVQTESDAERHWRCRVKGPASSSLVKLKLPEKARHRG